jgi:drug/metabolite transporter (DMT)-like permease
VAVFSLTPVFAVVLEPYLQGSTPSRAKAALGASLTAITGVLFLFPLSIPGSLRAGMALFALLTASFGIATAICFAAAAAFNPRAGWRWNLSSSLLGLLVIELPALFLLFWLMPRLAASRMTARFLIAPLMTLVLGMALETPSLPVRAWLGMLLLAGGAGWLVFAPAERPELEGLELRNTLTAGSPRQPPPAG